MRNMTVFLLVALLTTSLFAQDTLIHEEITQIETGKNEVLTEKQRDSIIISSMVMCSVAMSDIPDLLIENFALINNEEELTIEFFSSSITNPKETWMDAYSTLTFKKNDQGYERVLKICGYNSEKKGIIELIELIISKSLDSCNEKFIQMILEEKYDKCTESRDSYSFMTCMIEDSIDRAVEINDEEKDEKTRMRRISLLSSSILGLPKNYIEKALRKYEIGKFDAEGNVVWYKLGDVNIQIEFHDIYKKVNYCTIYSDEEI